MTTPDKNLPVYGPSFDEATEIKFVSIVEDPAIGVQGIALNKQEPIKLKFDLFKQIIAGPVLIPDILIYRNIEGIGEFNLRFSKEDIQKLYDIYNKSNNEKKINIDHNLVGESGYPNGTWIIEDQKFDKSNMYGYTDLPLGTWFMETKIENRDEFVKLKESNMTSFSIEGAFNLLKLSLNKNKFINMENEIKTETAIEEVVLEVVAEVKENEAPIEEVKTKLEVTPEDIAMIWEAIKPMIAEMLVGETKEEAPIEEAMTALESKLSKQIADLQASIKETPAAESITLSKVTDPRASDFQARLESIRKVAKL